MMLLAIQSGSDFEAVRDALRGSGVSASGWGDPQVWITLLAAAVLAAAVGGAVSLLLRDRRMHGAAFRTLCRGLAIPRPQRRMLRRIAAVARVRHPASLLVSRGCFDHAVATARVPARPQVDELRRRIFD